MEIHKRKHDVIFIQKKGVSFRKKSKKIQQKQLNKWTPLSTKVSPENSIPSNPYKYQSASRSKQKIITKEKKQKPPIVVLVKKDNKEVQPMQASDVSKELLRIKGNQPFDMAPDELIIEEKRIIVKRNSFPAGGSVVTLPIKHLVSFEVNHAILYSAVYIKGQQNNVNIVMQWLNPDDAVRAKEVIDGLRLQEAESIEIQEKDPKKIADALQSIGRT